MIYHRLFNKLLCCILLRSLKHLSGKGLVSLGVFSMTRKQDNTVQADLAAQVLVHPLQEYYFPLQLSI